MSERLLTPADAAERCRLSVKTVLRAIRAGRLRASRLGARGALRIRESDVDAWIEESVVVPRGRKALQKRQATPAPARSRSTGTEGQLVLPPASRRR